MTPRFVGATALLLHRVCRRRFGRPSASSAQPWSRRDPVVKVVPLKAAPPGPLPPLPRVDFAPVRPMAVSQQVYEFAARHPEDLLDTYLLLRVRAGWTQRRDHDCFVKTRAAAERANHRMGCTRAGLRHLPRRGPPRHDAVQREEVGEADSRCHRSGIRHAFSVGNAGPPNRPTTRQTSSRDRKSPSPARRFRRSNPQDRAAQRARRFLAGRSGGLTSSVGAPNTRGHRRHPRARARFLRDDPHSIARSPQPRPRWSDGRSS